ncbi:MAG: hypothetical protein QXO69_01715 [archaeon]
MNDKAQVSAELLIIMAVLVAVAAIVASSIMASGKLMDAKYDSNVKSALKEMK